MLSPALFIVPGRISLSHGTDRGACTFTARIHLTESLWTRLVETITSPFLFYQSKLTTAQNCRLVPRGVSETGSKEQGG